MKIGIFNSMLTKYSVEETAKKLRENGLDAIQLYFSFDGAQLTTLDLANEALCERIRAAFSKEGVEIVGLCGYQNLVCPREEARINAVNELKRYIALCPRFQTDLVVTEVGSTNPDSGWADHPNNYTDETWRAASETLKELCDSAAGYGVTIGIEPHFAQVAKDPKSMRRILDMTARKNIKAVFDPANLITPENADRADDVLKELFELNGNDIALLHAKDTKIVNGKSVFVGAGSGVLNYTLYGELAKRYGYQKPVILEYMSEAAIPAARDVVKSAFSR
jgi:L-ribulose-5-phosphate 3-epimerase